MNNILEKLDIMIPNPRCELEYHKDYELLIATVLSAQCTDARVNMVTKKLFTKYETFIIKNDNQYNFKIITKRKYKHKIINTIKNVDKSINVVIEKINVI